MEALLVFGTIGTLAAGLQLVILQGRVDDDYRRAYVPAMKVVLGGSLGLLTLALVIFLWRAVVGR